MSALTEEQIEELKKLHEAASDPERWSFILSPIMDGRKIVGNELVAVEIEAEPRPWPRVNVTTLIEMADGYLRLQATFDARKKLLDEDLEAECNLKMAKGE